MVKHFQHLFDVPNMAGMYPRMNEIYTRYNEMRNVQRTLAELLDLGKDLLKKYMLLATSYMFLMYEEYLYN